MKGRTFEVSNAKNKVVMFDYKDIILGKRSAAGYIALCKNYHTILIKNITAQSSKDRDAARRMITFIDEMYNHNVKFYFTSEVELSEIFNIQNM